MLLSSLSGWNKIWSSNNPTSNRRKANSLNREQIMDNKFFILISLCVLFPIGHSLWTVMYCWNFSALTGLLAAAVCKLLKILNCFISRGKKLFCCGENWRQHWNLKRFKSEEREDKLCMSYIGFHHHKPLASSSVHYLLVSRVKVIYWSLYNTGLHDDQKFLPAAQT